MTINREITHDGGVLTVHAITDFHIDAVGGRVELTVGSWGAAQLGAARVTHTVLLCVPVWDIDYCTRVQEFFESHPDWCGTGPARPSSDHIWAPLTLEWVAPVVDLDKVKADQWAKVKRDRAIAEYAGFAWDGSVFDSNPTSQQRIYNNVTRAQSNPSFSEAWTLADNTARTLNAQDMVSVGVALGDHVAAQVARSQALRNEIEAATTAEQVVTVDFISI